MQTFLFEGTAETVLFDSADPDYFLAHSGKCRTTARRFSSTLE
jgi:hypothetical protein